MMRAWRWVAAGLVLGALPACSMLKKPGTADAGDGGESAPTAVVEAAAAPLAVNEGDITRYPDEKTSTGSTLTTESPTELRTEVGAGGKLVVNLKKGTEVDKLAEHTGHYLVVAEDPKDASRKLMGWAGTSAFTVGIFHGPSVAHDGGGAAAGDGGLHAATTGDAGPAPATGGAPVCVKQNPPGKCAAGYNVSGAVCRRPCAAASDCSGPDPKCNGGLCYNSGGCN